MEDLSVASGPVLAAAGAGSSHTDPGAKYDHQDCIGEDEGGDARREGAVRGHVRSVPSVLSFNGGDAVSSRISEVRPRAEGDEDREDQDPLPGPTMQGRGSVRPRGGDRLVRSRIKRTRALHKPL